MNYDWLSSGRDIGDDMLAYFSAVGLNNNQSAFAYEDTRSLVDNAELLSSLNN